MQELDWIEYYADDLKSRADAITRYTNTLVNRPPYETRAEVSLIKAETALVDALRKVRDAKFHYANKEAA